jgi:hypothetical protein
MDATKTTGDHEWLLKAYLQAKQNADELRRMYMAATQKSPKELSAIREKHAKELQSRFRKFGG